MSTEKKKRGRKPGYRHSAETKLKMSKSHLKAWKNKRKNGYGEVYKRLKQGLHKISSK